MDVSALLELFPPDGPGPTGPSGAPDVVADLVDLLGGVSLAGGLYRVFTVDEVTVWTARAGEAFPRLTSSITAFGADWLGRLFVVDTARRDVTGRPLVLLLDVGAGEVMEIPETLEGLHVSELVKQHDAALASVFYGMWRDGSGDRAPLLRSECVGYEVPLFLGGADDVSNLARGDMDVYWSLTGQLVQQAVGLPVGTIVHQVAVEPAPDPPRPRRRLFGRR